MKQLHRTWRFTATALVAAIAFAVVTPQIAFAGTTGTINGVVRDDQTGAPIANARVTAASGSQTESTTTNSVGYYSLQALIPDTYTLSFAAEGYNSASDPGVNVQQDLVSKVDFRLTKSIKTIAAVTSRAAGNLVKPYTGTDVYNVSGQQLKAATGGDGLHHTIYEYLDTVPGVTPIGGGYPAEPSIRGGYDVDNGYELDGIPITERMTGFFTTNLTDLGIGNVEVYTGGLSAQNAGNGVGVINSVIKTGTYPSFGTVSVGLTSPMFNHFLRTEYGSATLDHRFSYYMGFDYAGSQNDFNNGNVAFSLPVVGISSGNPGYIQTWDFVGNVHFRPNPRDDIQLLYQNSLFNDGVNYALYSGTKNAPLLSLEPCAGVQPSTTTNSGGIGGTSPTGQYCPEGLYFNPLGNGAGNFLGHYSGIGKVQWNHVINSHSSFALRLAENFNQYIFDQRLTDPNDSAFGSPRSGCPSYPYAAYSPLLDSTTSGGQCTMDLGDYYQSRYGNDYYGQLDYTNTPSENLTIKAGIGQEYDNMKRDVRYLNVFNSSATAAYQAAYTDIPMHVPYVYVDTSINAGKFTFEPGLRYSRAYYAIPAEPQLTGPFQPNGIPGGTVSTGFLAPSFLGTYRINPNNVIRYSYATTGQYIGTEFVYRLNSTSYNPFYIPADANGNPGPTTGYKPQVNTSFDLQWEHQFDPNTSLKIGPYYRFSNNYLAIFSPLISPPGAPPKYGPDQISNNLKIRSFGIEAGLSHQNNRPTGMSYWISASYNNYWTQVSDYGQVAFVNFPIDDYFVKQGIMVRSAYVPPFAATFTADLHTAGFHLIPDVYYTFGNFYRLGACSPGGPVNQYTQGAGCDSTPVPEMLPELQGMGYWIANLTLAKDLGTKFTAGVRVLNISNNESGWTSGTTPCYNDQDPNLPTGQGSGCFPYNGTTSGTIAPVGYIYQKLTQNPRTYEFFLNYKF